MLRTAAVAQAVTALDEKLRREAKRHLFWSRFMGNISKQENYNNDMVLSPSEKPIEVNSMINSPGLGDRMLIPMTLELAGLGRLGDAVMLGHEEDIARKYAMIHYNQIRHGVPLQKGKKEYSVDKILQILEDHVGKLGWWFAQRENWEIIHAIYLGAGEMLTTSTTDATYGQGLGLDKRIHPNLYGWDSTDAKLYGLMGGNGTQGAALQRYPTAAELHQFVNDGDYVGTNGTDTDSFANPGPMTTACLRKARTLVYNDLYLKPLFTHNGQKYWGIMLDPVQADTLRADAMFVANGSAAPLAYGLENHPMINGSIGMYGQFVVFEDPVAVRGWVVDGTNVDILGTKTAVYDTTDKANPRFLPQEGRTVWGGGSSNRVAIIMGGSMLGKAEYSPLSFETESFDYNNWKGLAAGTMYGYERLDFIAESQAPTYSETTTSSATTVYNRSSALIMTCQD